MAALELEPFSLRMRITVRAAWGTLDRRELLRVKMRDTGNDFGYGEAAPLEPYDGVSLAAVRAELERGEPTLPHSVAAVDMAQWDLRGRREGRPVAALLADDPLPAVPVNALVGAEDRERASAQATAAVTAGFRCVKVKVGVGDDAGRLAAVRAAVGPDVALRIDANGAWSVEEAVAALGALEPVGIELCEEPVHGLEGLRAVRAAVSIPIAMDETALEPGAIGSDAADAVCLRVGAHGGITRLLEEAATARAAGTDVYLASTYDGPVGVAAALHAAAALKVTRPCGLATLALFDGLTDPFPPADGAMAVPEAAGLGVS